MNTFKFEGSPIAIGADVFDQMVIPVICGAARGMPPANLMQLYLGFLSALYGSMCADFGKPMTDQFVGATIEKLRSQAQMETVQ